MGTWCSEGLTHARAWACVRGVHAVSSRSHQPWCSASSGTPTPPHHWGCSWEQRWPCLPSLPRLFLNAWILVLSYGFTGTGALLMLGSKPGRRPAPGVGGSTWRTWPKSHLPEPGSDHSAASQTLWEGVPGLAIHGLGGRLGLMVSKCLDKKHLITFHLRGYPSAWGSASIQRTEIPPNNRHCCLVAQSCPTLCHPMDCNLPDSSVHGILQARILEWVAILSFKGSS